MKNHPAIVALRMIGIWVACLIPTPTYGNHGGYYKRSDKDPIDHMDEAFKCHDLILREAFTAWDQSVKMANIALGMSLKGCRPGSTYGKLYKKFASIIFKGN